MVELFSHALTSTLIIEVKAWMSNYISLFYVDVIAFPFPYPNTGLHNLC